MGRSLLIIRYSKVPQTRADHPKNCTNFAHVMAHGRFAHGRLIEITDSYTLLSEDQPGELASAIRQFVRGTPELAKMRSIAWGA